MGNSQKNFNEMRVAIKAEVRRTRISGAGILEVMWRSGIDRTGLDAKTIGSWSLLNTIGIDTDAYERVMSVYAKQPTLDNAIGRANHIPLSKKMVKALDKEHKRSKVGIRALKNNNKKSLSGITEVRISSLLKGRVKTTDKNLYDAVLLAWKNQPDGAPTSAKQSTKSKNVNTAPRAITKDEIEHLRALTLITGIKIEDLVTKSCGHANYPKEISPYKARQIVEGERLVVPAGWFDFILKAYSKKPRICEITPQTLKKIKKLL